MANRYHNFNPIDGLTGNGDKEWDDKWGYGRVEYAYHLMAEVRDEFAVKIGRVLAA